MSSKKIICGILSATIYIEALEEFDLDKIVVSASGFEQEAQSNLRNIILIDKEELKKHGYTSLKQALERISVISFVDSGLGANVDMRGQGSKSNVAVKVMVDGKMINVLDNSHGVTPLDSININQVERIEIIPGGGSVLYGNGTRGGVIHIITQKSKQQNFQIHLNTTNFDRGALGGNLGTSMTYNFNPYLTLNFNAQGFNKKGYQKGYSEKGYFIDAKNIIDIDEYNTLIFSYDYFWSKDTSSGYLTKNQIQSDPTQRGDSDKITKTIRPALSLDFTHQFNANFELNIQSFWQNQKIDFIKSVSQMMGTHAYEDGSGFEDGLRGVTLKARYNYEENSYFTLGYEFAYHDAQRNSKVFYSVPPIITYHRMTTLMDMDKQSHSLFILDSHNLGALFLNFGLRYEYSLYDTARTYRNQMAGRILANSIDTTSRFDTHKTIDNFAFEITPNYQYSDTGSLYFKYERGFISPTPAQLVNRNNTTANPTLEPYYTADLNSEIFDTFELGMKDFWFDFYTFNLALFYTKSKNEISYLGDPHSAAGAWWRYYNIDETRRMGAELQLSQIFDKLLLKQSLSYIDARISKGINKDKIIPYVSKVKITATAEYNLTNEWFSFLDLSYLSRAKDNGNVDENTGKMRNNQWIKDYFLTDLGLGYRKKNLQISTGIRNLFDKQYYSYQDSFKNQYLPGSGRNYYIEFKYAF
ncbi:TonB-dependent receptor [Campylobacter cuniculorum]|uniref:Heme uptake system outer membrane receptor n=2 Tax=Campylobacter cuniculorum TaxID=374106 RepID=A0A1W6BYX8_9BACT|nr:TonB-dependent receptor [Campylobacter cuniculorum]ARJ57309.1 heme uptake system outer membrane receptor [Campylobacter cuniculorum DSM 23162 = LMG 24588]QOR04744.1 TonB-dependent receptor [Campylobacter cuniculorum]